LSENLERLHRFITRVFVLLMNRLDAVAGRDTIRAVFRLVGETVGERVEKRLREKYNVASWNPEKFAELVAKDVIAPVVGDRCVSYEGNEEEARITFTACPFEKLDLDITTKFYCTYTHGLIEEAARRAFGEEVKVEAESLKSEGADRCSFKIKKQSKLVDK